MTWVHTRDGSNLRTASLGIGSMDIASMKVYSDSRFDDLPGTRDHWPVLEPTYHQYLIILTNTAHLVVDLEPTITVDEHNNGHVQYMYDLKHKFPRPCAVCLDPKWRRRQPAKLKFMVVERFYEGSSLMLIERSGPVAHRVQMVDKRVSNRPWMNDDRHRDIVILG
jgi:hypothetical protein